MTENENGHTSKSDSVLAAALTVGEGSASESEFAAPCANRRPARVVAWCVVLLAAVAIVVCGWSIAAPLLQSSQGQSQESAAVQDESAQRSDEGDASESSNSEDADAAAGDGASANSADEEPEADGASLQDASGSNASQGTDGTTGSVVASGGSSSTNATASGETNGSSGSGSGSQAGSSAGQTPAPNTVTVTVTIDSSAAGSPVSLSTTLTFQQGATVYDALAGSGVAIGASQTAYGVYVASIGGLAEKQHGPTSGWTYYVNGAFINTACSNYVLSDGDSVLWTYVNVTE